MRSYLAGCRGATLVSPSINFTIFNNSTAVRHEIEQGRGAQLPNRLVNMTLTHFIEHFNHEHKTIFYPQEHYYFQGPPPADLFVEEHMLARPIACVQKGGCPTSASQDCDADSMTSTFSQIRLRISPISAVHALHFDTSATILVQLKGVKIVTLIPPKDLQKMYPYGQGHILNRRARIELTAIDKARFPMAMQLKPYLVRLYPGDVLVFPAWTGHTTLALSDSIAISARMPLKSVQPQI